jgi:uncharacterized membrane protein YphA (DoxX/SURF4 family)
VNFLIKLGRAFYSLALMVYGLQQIYFGNFRGAFFSPYQRHLPALQILAWLFGFFLIGSGLIILVGKSGKRVALLLGAVFFTLLVGTHLTYELISEPNKLYHLGLWASVFMGLALCGGAFVVADSFPAENISRGVYRFLNRVAPYCHLFFPFAITTFGISHFMYVAYLEKTIPAWIPDHLFSVYFTGTALLASGVAIALSIRIRPVSLLLALMFFLWFWMMHIPGAWAQPFVNRGAYVAGADDLAFSGTALLIALTVKKQRWVRKLESWTQ